MPPRTAALGRPAKGLPRYFMDVGWYRHPRFAGLSVESLFVFEAAVGYCTEHATDGHLPADHEDLAAALGLRLSWVKKAITPLLDRKIMTRSGAEIVVRNWADHNPTRDEIEAHARERSRSGSLGNHKRWHEGKGVSDPDCEHCSDPDSDRSSDPIAIANRSHGMGWDGNPPLSPIAPPTETPPDTAGAGAPTDDDNPTTRTVEAALDHMAQCDLARAKAEGQPIRQPAAWTRTARANRADAHRHDLTGLAAGQPGIDPVDLAEQIDPACGPLDGGAARAQRRWERQQAEGEAADRRAAETRARRKRADQAIARLRTDNPDRLAELEAQADAALDPDLTVGRKTLALQKLRQLVLDTEETQP